MKNRHFFKFIFNIPSRVLLRYKSHTLLLGLARNENQVLMYLNYLENIATIMHLIWRSFTTLNDPIMISRSRF